MFSGVKSLKEFYHGKGLRLNLIAVILGIMVLAPMVAAADDVNPGVYPVDSVICGKTYGEWSEEWWKWALSIPLDRNPLTDTTGEFCAEGQSGDVWFIGGIISTQPSPIQITRTCTIPAGKALFFPVINGECSRIEGNGETEEELRACANNQMEYVTVKEAKVDGKKLKNLDDYRVESDLFIFKLPKDNILGLHPGSSKSVADGYWIMLEPLSEGKHTIYIHGKMVFPDGSSFETEVTYKITVV
jgi:hypothetical protein